MAARARARPAKTSRPPRRSPRRTAARRASPRRRLSRAELAGVVLAAIAIASLPFIIDLGSLLTGIRDSVARNFGLGVFIVAGLAAAAGLAIAGGAHRNRARFLRLSAGLGLAAFVAWGLLGMNRAAWSTGSVDFEEYTLGGRIGEALVSGWLGVLAWLSACVLALWLLAPSALRWIVATVPAACGAAWRRRYPHRAAAAAAAAFAWLFSRRGPEGQLPLPPEVEPPRPRPVPTFETEPVRIRPSLDAASPISIIGAGAAVALTAPHPEETPTGGAPADPSRTADDGALADPHAPLPARPETGWQLPALELLNTPIPSSSRKHDNSARAQLIVDTLASFGVDATVVEINEGPTVTQFGVEPGWEVKYKDVAMRDEAGKPLLGADGRPRTERFEVTRTRVRVNKITALQNDLALALAAPTLRIEAPVPGRAIVGIEVPNDAATVVSLRAVMESKDYQDLARKSRLAIALGKGVSGTPVVADLAKMPHLLIAGATGSGKSVCMNAIISGLVMNATPEEVRFVMVDPKRVELSAFAQIPHLAFSEVIVDMDKVVGTLQAVVSEMEARYKKFATIAVRNIESYNNHPRTVKKLPYWVIVIDELADLMMAAPFEVEKLICRLAQLARATGIHLVVATQRPSVDVITGLIKANFPTRIAFAVTSQTDSRTILDAGGAEKLLGRGDMLYMPTDAAKPIRIQGVYVSDHEVERLVEFWRDDRFKALAPEMSDDLLEAALVARNGGDDELDIDEDDPVLAQARDLATMHERISPSMIQRRLRVGYMKACRVIDALEEEGLVGPREEGESRRVMQRQPSDSSW